MNKKYVENVVAWLRRKSSFAEKFDCAGVYCLKANEQIVYIGKSKNMLERLAAHYVGIKERSELKYRILAEAQDKGCVVSFDVLHYTSEYTWHEIEEDIGEMEGKLIRQYCPILNTQIPKEENWRKWDIQKIHKDKALCQILGIEKDFFDFE